MVDDRGHLFQEHSERVFRRALQLLRDADEADDVVQEVFMRAIDAPRAGVMQKPAAWLFRVTTNLCLNRLRDEARRRSLRSLHMESGDGSFVRDPVPAIAMNRALSGMNQKAALAVIYVHLHGMTHREAANRIGVSRRTIFNMLRAFQRLVSNVS